MIVINLHTFELLKTIAPLFVDGMYPYPVSVSLLVIMALLTDSVERLIVTHKI